MIEYMVKVHTDGSNQWYLNGQLHREDGLPAIECADGSKQWYLNGKRHREDGPAIECADGYKVWFLNGHELTEKQFLNKIKPKDDNAELVKCLKQILECLEGEE